MTKFEKIRAARGNKAALEPLLSDDLVISSPQHKETFCKQNALEWNDAVTSEKYELLFETDSQLVCHGRERNQDGLWAVIDAWEHDGNKLTACCFMLALVEEDEV